MHDHDVLQHHIRLVNLLAFVPPGTVLGEPLRAAVCALAAQLRVAREAIRDTLARCTAGKPVTRQLARFDAAFRNIPALAAALDEIAACIHPLPPPRWADLA
jgi:hypothetical protein